MPPHMVYIHNFKRIRHLIHRLFAGARRPVPAYSHTCADAAVTIAVTTAITTIPILFITIQFYSSTCAC